MSQRAIPRSKIAFCGAKVTLFGTNQPFEKVSSFLSTLGGGKLNFANESYTEYVLERLSSCIR